MNVFTRPLLHLLLVLLASPGISITTLSIRAAEVDPASPSPKWHHAQGLSLPNFNLEPGGVLSWPNKLRLSCGGGEEYAAKPVGEIVPAQPGGSLVIQAIGDYKRCAIDMIPTQGKYPHKGALGELTIHRFHPEPLNQEMISYAALGPHSDFPNSFGVIVEAHGTGKLRPLCFTTVRSPYPTEKDAQPFVAEAMRMTAQGTMQFGTKRVGGKLKRPVDIVTLEQPEPQQVGAYDSDYLTWVGKYHDGTSARRTNWRANARVLDPSGASEFVLQNDHEETGRSDTLKVTDTGNVQLPTPGSAVVLTSPNGTEWHLTVDNSGNLKVNTKQ